MLPVNKTRQNTNLTSTAEGKGVVYKPLSRPKPDIAWGYHTRVFDGKQQGELSSVPRQAKVFGGSDPHWPWLVAEMKPGEMVSILDLGSESCANINDYLGQRRYLSSPT